MTQVAGEERHLVDSHHHDALRTGDQAGNRLDVVQLQAPRALVQVDQIGGQRGLEFAVPECQEGRLGSVPGSPGGRMRAPLVLVACRLLKLREPVEAERLGEPDDCRAGRVRAPGKLFGRLERRFFQVVHYVAGHVLL